MEKNTPPKEEVTSADSQRKLVEKRVLADPPAVNRMLNRLAHEIVERNGGLEGVVIVGIRRGGYFLAKKLALLVEQIEGAQCELGAVDITLYRDDVFEGLPRPQIGPTELPFELAGQTIVLVDDVLFTGRTVRAALDAIMDYGRPKAVQLAVLIDRGRRELPIRADYVGLTVETTASQSVKVNFDENENVQNIVLREKQELP